jgi:nicotinic acid mononucleotide adenylyltransferase
VCDAQGVTTYRLILAKGRRTRHEEENLVSLLILKAVADVCRVEGVPSLDLFETETLVADFEPIDWLTQLLAGEIGWVAISPDGQMRPGKTWPNIAFLSGAFNPLHNGHRRLAEVATKRLRQNVCFELPLVNAEKALLDLAEAQRRAAQFAGFATVILTQAPLFNQKAQLFPRSVFVLGIDTVERLWQPRFYHDDPLEMYAAFNAVQAAGCRFEVAGRWQRDRFLTLQDLDIPTGYRELFAEIPEVDFRVDISSTAIRTGQVKGHK